MAVEDKLFQHVLLNKIVPILAAATAIWYFRDFILHHTFKRAYAFILNRITKNVLKREKKRCFRHMHELRDRLNRDLMVLEIGSGSATNLEYMPYNTNLCCLDPNPHFIGYIQKNLKKNKTVVTVEIAQGVAENIPKPNNTFDVVVSSLVLCTVKDVPKTLAEVHRVLKPGGVFLFIEHGAAEGGSWTFSVQKGISPLHKLIGDGCDPSRNFISLFKNSCFSDVQTHTFRIREFPFWLKYGYTGKATK